eukprot:CAMPEP_0170548922 /NCGR_PEP_ID=MMETSP0211-20121228/7094_1 /TAXON_ID=311385 /ORGANISM="Pseudokeronopsis sp., Strain OXSARD2" /LENGTH=161 /DNA_ID=CAMNT_0010854635 /DNA_START=1468 /DNA_END=1953 /DNA_ORIENTATION=-
MIKDIIYLKGQAVKMLLKDSILIKNEPLTKEMIAEGMVYLTSLIEKSVQKAREFDSQQYSPLTTGRELPEQDGKTEKNTSPRKPFEDSSKYPRKKTISNFTKLPSKVTNYTVEQSTDRRDSVSIDPPHFEEKKGNEDEVHNILNEYQHINKDLFKLVSMTN